VAVQGGGQSRLSRLENEDLGTEAGLKALETALMRSIDTLMRRKKKQRLIVDVDSTKDPAHGKQENVAFNGHFGKNCFHPLFAGRRWYVHVASAFPLARYDQSVLG